MIKPDPDKLITSLLDDDKFLRWLTEPSGELESYWRGRIEQSPEIEEYAVKIRDILADLSFDEPVVPQEVADEVWAYIRKNTIARKSGIRHRRRLAVVISSAAALLVISFAGYFAYEKLASDDSSDAMYRMLTQSPLDFTNDNISLIVSDSITVDIERDAPEVLSREQDGTFNINAEDIDRKLGASSVNQLVVPYGRLTTLTFCDGTKIWVNSGSRVIYPSVFEKKKREIYVAGEVYLDVAGDKYRTFVVKTKHMDVNATGTRFNVTAYDDDDVHSVILVDGAVSVYGKEVKSKHALTPNHMFALNTVSKESSVREVDVDAYTAWVDGYMIFKSENMMSVLQKLERHYNMPFVYDADKCGNIFVSGKLDLRNDIRDVLNNIVITVPVKFSVSDSTVIVE